MLTHIYQKTKHLSIAMLSLAMLCSLVSCLDISICSGSDEETAGIQILISDVQSATMCDMVSNEKPTCSQETFIFFRVDTAPNLELSGLFWIDSFLNVVTLDRKLTANGTGPPGICFISPNKHRGPPVFV